MKFDNSVIEMVNSCWIGTELARKLGLNSRFFSRFTKNRPKSLHDGILIQSTSGLILVRIPEDVSSLLRDGTYVVSKIEDGNESIFDYVFQITADTKIGFWK